jgi:hypothetical protein
MEVMIEMRLRIKNGSPGGIRTPDTVVNSHLLYQLSYRGRSDPNNLPKMHESQPSRGMSSGIYRGYIR